MLKDKKQEREEIIKKIKEIDKILGTETYINKLISKDDMMDIIISATAFGILDSVINLIAIENPPFNPNAKTLIASMLAGGAFGTLFIIKEKNKDRYGFKDMYRHYEYAYTRLSRKDQIEVLKKSKELYNLLSNDLKYNNNIKMAKEYLNINDSQRTFFENLDYEHPYHQLLTNEQEKEIHNQGLLTPEEVVRYWESGFSDVCIPSDKNRCDRFKDCHDCLVHYSETKPNGWEKIHFYQKTLGPKPNKERN